MDPHFCPDSGKYDGVVEKKKKPKHLDKAKFPMGFLLVPLPSPEVITLFGFMFFFPDSILNIYIYINICEYILGHFIQIDHSRHFI